MTARQAADTTRALRARPAGELTASGDPWRTAVEQAPRHVFVPSYLEQDVNGQWRTITSTRP
jgi:hypothetical protein